MRLVTILLHGELQAPVYSLSDRRLQEKMKTCLYCNRTNKVVIPRCIGSDIFFHEKVVFPWEEWIFPALQPVAWTPGAIVSREQSYWIPSVQKSLAIQRGQN